jgi:serine/threonine protein kinase
LSVHPAGEKPQLKLGRYDIVRELGKGAMGIVYLAKDPLIGRLVALKTIRPVAHAEDDETKEFKERFIREAQAAGILNHPSIVTVFDIGEDEPSATNFIAMEYVEGQNLKEILAQGRPLTWEQIGDIITQIADALDFAHSKGIVHRDVKPANIILLDGNRAKIMDFGIAKIASGAANLTSTGQFLGTPNYMAPEQIKGTAVDGRTDLFALGICLYECLTRRKPFGGDSLTSISYKIVHEPFPPLHEINPQIPEGFEDVVAGCLAKDPAKRYQRGRDLANALRAAVRGERPAKFEPLLAEETMVTRTDKDRMPTIEMPFPEAMFDTGPQSEVGLSSPGPAMAAESPSAPAPAIGRRSRAHVAQQLRQTLTNVRAYPGWRKRIPMAAVWAVVGLLVIGLLAAVLTIKRQQASIPIVDKQAEARRFRERQLRMEGDALLKQGNIAAAHEKYEQLGRLAPKSPAVTLMLEKLSAIRQQEELSKQQLVAASQKRDQGITLFNEKKYPEAIAVLQESFSINPGDENTVNYLKLAQEEEQKAQAAKLAATKARQPAKVGPAKVAGTAPVPAPAAAPARLTTVFNSPFSDGFILVKAGADTLVHENLFEEKGRFIRRKTPRAVNTTKEVTPKNADLMIWVVVPAQKIQEQHIIRHNFLPGSSQRLIVSYNQQSRKFDYQLN